MKYIPSVGDCIFQKWPQQYFWLTFFLIILPIPSRDGIYFPSLKTWIGLWTAWKNWMQQEWYCVMSEHLFLTLSPFFSAPSLELLHYSVRKENLAHKKRLHGKGRWRGGTRAQWQPTLVTTHVCVTALRWFQPADFRSPTTAPDSVKQRKAISAAPSLNSWHTGIQAQNKS